MFLLEMAKPFEKLPRLKQNMGGSLQTDLFLAKILWLIFSCIIYCQELLGGKASILMVSAYSVTAEDSWMPSLRNIPIMVIKQKQELVLPPASN